MMLIDYMTMRNGDYHEKQITYNMSALLQEVKRHFPQDGEPDLSSEKYAQIVKNCAHSPAIMGGLAKELGIQNTVLTLDLWRDLSNGYCPAGYLPSNSVLLQHVRETPRGPMVVLNKNASAIDSAGAYVKKTREPGKKPRSIGTEFVFGMASNFSKVMARLMTEDSAVEMQFKKIIDEVLSKKILPAMLEEAGVRSGKDGVDLGYAKGIMAVSFLHIENRGVEPYLHVHFDLLNAAIGFDEKLTSLYSGMIAKNKDTYNALFQAEMKERLENETGFVFVPVILEEDKNDDFLKDYEKNICSYDLPDTWVPDTVREFYSVRSKEMARAMKGKQGFLAEEIARVSSRDDKSVLSSSEMKALWKQQMDDMGWMVGSVIEKLHLGPHRTGIQNVSDNQLARNFVRKFQRNSQAKYGPDEYGETDADAALRAQSDQKLIKGFLRKHKQVCFTEGQFKAHIVKQLIHTMNKEQAMKSACRIFEDQCIQLLDKEKVAYYQDFLEDKIADPRIRKQYQIRYVRDMLFTTKEIRAQELAIYEWNVTTQMDDRFVIAEREAMNLLLAFEDRVSKELNKPVVCTRGQREAVMLCLTRPAVSHFIMGDAGTGKSFAARCIKEAMESKGFKVLATAPTNKAVAGLGKDALFKEGDYCSLSKLLNDLDDGKLHLDDRTLLIADEMGMACQDDYYRIVQHIGKANAKLISIGDAKQIQSVAHGSVFRVMSERFVEVTAKLTEISRQHSDMQREMVQDFAYGRAHKAIRKLYDEGRVFITATEAQKHLALVKHYLSVPDIYKQKVIVTATNMDSEILNAAIRKQLKADGILSKDASDEVLLKGRDGVERAFCMGDRIMFTRGQRSDDQNAAKLMNSEIGTVRALKETFDGTTGKTTKTAIWIDMDDGRTVWLSTQKVQNVKHGYAGTIAKSQGSTYDSGFYVPSANMDSLHDAYVACSRHRKDVFIYLSDELADQVTDNMDERAPTAKMLETAMAIAAMQNVQLSEEEKQSFGEIRAFLNAHYKVIGGKTVGTPHRLDDFTNIVEAWSCTRFKKSTFQFEVMEGVHADQYRDMKAEIHNMHQYPESDVRTHADSTPNAPVIQSKLALSQQVHRVKKYTERRSQTPDLSLTVE